MTDAVGGVRVYAEEASNGSGNGGPVVIKKGWNDLDGEQALAFVRERYTAQPRATSPVAAASRRSSRR